MRPIKYVLLRAIIQKFLGVPPYDRPSDTVPR